MKKNKYLFVIPSLSKGGAQRVVSILASKLITQNRESIIVTHFIADQEYVVGENVKIICLSDLKEHEYRKKISFKFLLQLAWKLRTVIKEEDPDYILPFLWTTCVRVDIALLFSKYKKRVIQTVRNNPYIFPEKALMKKYRDYLVKKSCMTIVQNNDQKEYFSQDLHHKIHVLHNPISEELFSLALEKHEDEIHIIGVGRLEKQKNFPLLIRAFYDVYQKHPNVRLDIFGEGSLRKQLQEEINNLHLEHVVKLRGRSNSYTEIYAKASIFVLSSDFEGMPNTLLEAMAVGLPCISTNCPTGPKDIIKDEINGYLIPINDCKMLVDRIVALIESPSMANRIAIEGRKSIEKYYNSVSIVTKLIKICERKSEKIINE